MCCCAIKEGQHNIAKMAFVPWGSVFVGVIFHQVKKMKIYESRKEVLGNEIHSAKRWSDSWSMPEESNRYTREEGEGVTVLQRTGHMF